MSTRCVECGGSPVHSTSGSEGDPSCEACFHALLAYENERPRAFGAVHHLTVASYFLQHPAGYGAEILRAWQEILSTPRATSDVPRDLQRRMARRFDGPTKVREKGAMPPASWPRDWTMRVADVIVPGEDVEVEEYIRRARRWADETLAALVRSQAAAL